MVDTHVLPADDRLDLIKTIYTTTIKLLVAIDMVLVVSNY